MKTRQIAILHGWGADTKKFFPLAKALEAKGWRVLLIDLPGFGLPAPKEAWNLDNYVNFVSNKARNYFKKGKFFLFGHSFGGRIAVKLAANDQDRLEGLILCSAAGFSRVSFAKRTVFLFLSKIGKIFLFYPPLANLFRKILYRAAREHDYEKSGGIMKEVFKKVVSEDLKKVVRVIKIPTLLLWGKDDRMTPLSGAYFLQGVLPKTSLTVFDNGGHRLPYERPVKLAGEIEKWFLTLV